MWWPTRVTTRTSSQTASNRTHEALVPAGGSSARRTAGITKRAGACLEFGRDAGCPGPVSADGSASRSIAAVGGSGFTPASIRRWSRSTIGSRRCSSWASTRGIAASTTTAPRCWPRFSATNCSSATTIAAGGGRENGQIKWILDQL